MRMELIQPFINAADAVFAESLQGPTKIIDVEMDDNTLLLLDFGDGVFALSGGQNAVTSPSIGWGRFAIWGSGGALDLVPGRGLEISSRSAMVDGFSGWPAPSSTASTLNAAADGAPPRTISSSMAANTPPASRP